ncbi:MAG: homoserine O-succinyltransferase [Chromatiales bacterium]|nr:homoserine O-succinyltransferase [Chromatiales bacterium]
MSLIAHRPLPTYERLAEEGFEVLSEPEARQQDIRELHIGLLNMMPDAALEATERQFFRLVASCNRIVQFYLHPFSIDGVPRGERGRAHIERYYTPFEQIREQGLDALIISGANVAGSTLPQEPFWPELVRVFDWAREHVTSVLCSCLATHALVEHEFGIARKPLGFKRWGVFEHRVVDRTHPLVNDINTRLDVPHSRFNDISRADFDGCGLHVLIESEVAGAHLAVSADGLRVVYFQGHPEYDSQSLLKEYKREITRWHTGERPDYPPLPENYFDETAQAVLGAYRGVVERSRAAGEPLPTMPETDIVDFLDNTWRDSAKAVVNNWLGKVYQVTDANRHSPFMPGIDPADPLGWHGQG